MKQVCRQEEGQLAEGTGWCASLPANGVSHCSIKASRHNDESGVELIGNGQQHVLEGRQVVAVAHAAGEPGHIHREALAWAGACGIMCPCAWVEHAPAARQEQP